VLGFTTARSTHSSTTTLALRFSTTSAEGVPPCAPALVHASVPAVEAFLRHSTIGCPPAKLATNEPTKASPAPHRVHDGLPILELSRTHVDMNVASLSSLIKDPGCTGVAEWYSMAPSAPHSHHDDGSSLPCTRAFRHFIITYIIPRRLTYQSWVIQTHHRVVDVLQLVLVDDEKVDGVVRIPSIFSPHQSTELR